MSRLRRIPAWLVFGALSTIVASSSLAEEAFFEDGFESAVLCGWSAGLSCISDEFDDGILDGWIILFPEAADVSEVGGRLRIAAEGSTIWYQDSTSVLIAKDVTGDFEATARVTARRLDPNDTEPPLPPFRMGGLSARDPADPLN